MFSPAKVSTIQYTTNSSPSDFIAYAKVIFKAAFNECRAPQDLMVRVCKLLQDADAFTGFMEFVNKMAAIDSEWNLWVQFVFSTCHCYLTLFLAVQGSNWKLQLLNGSHIRHI